MEKLRLTIFFLLRHVEKASSLSLLKKLLIWSGEQLQTYAIAFKLTMITSFLSYVMGTLSKFSPLEFCLNSENVVFLPLTSLILA